VVYLDGIQDSTLRNKLKQLFIVMELEQVVGEEDEGVGERANSTSDDEEGYAIPENEVQENIAMNNVCFAISICCGIMETAEKVTSDNCIDRTNGSGGTAPTKEKLIPRSIRGATMPPPGGYANDSSSSSDDKEGPAPAGSDNARSRVEITGGINRNIGNICLGQSSNLWLLNINVDECGN